MATATGIPNSRVHRHLKSMERRQQYGESYLWETVEGENWLRLLVLGAIYCVTIQGVTKEWELHAVVWDE